MEEQDKKARNFVIVVSLIAAIVLAILILII